MRTTPKCHGDFTVDNILIENATNSPVLIDPSDDNIIKGPLFDISRLMQSLLGGYEFLNTDNSVVKIALKPDQSEIEYMEARSSRYLEISEWLYTEIFPDILNENEILSIKFHVGVFYTRMLTHRYVINGETAMKYAAVSIRYLNEFYQSANNE
jgi:hypothetical protein